MTDLDFAKYLAMNLLNSGKTKGKAIEDAYKNLTIYLEELGC